MARPPKGPALVDRFEGSEVAKKRLRIILETISGELSVLEARRLLGLSETRFHEIREEALRAALDALSPSLPGRPSTRGKVSAEEVAFLRKRVRELEDEVVMATIREALLRAFPEEMVYGSEKKNEISQDVLERLSMLDAADRIRVDRMDRTRRCPRDRAGLASQRQRRKDEQTVHDYIAKQAEQYKAKGGTYVQFAEKCDIPLRTLERWISRRRQAKQLKPLGRPPERGTHEQRRELWKTMTRLGPKAGEPTLRKKHPDMPVGELRRMKKTYLAWHRRSRRSVFRLVWTKPGRVWAVDFGRPPAFLEPGYESFLIVRDVASGKVITTCPVYAEDSDAVEEVLSFLFAYYGPPLVLKSDNGPAFVSFQLQSFLRRWKVLHLLSPAYTPSYNGSAENGIGMLKALAAHRAFEMGREDAWSIEDLAWAMDVYNNVIARRDGTTASERHAGVTPVTKEERQEFIASYARQIPKALEVLEIPKKEKLSRKEKAKMNRLALRNALVERGYLFIRRKVITPRKKSPFTAIIS